MHPVTQTPPLNKRLHKPVVKADIGLVNRGFQPQIWLCRCFDLTPDGGESEWGYSVVSVQLGQGTRPTVIHMNQSLSKTALDFAAEFSNIEGTGALQSDLGYVISDPSIEVGRYVVTQVVPVEKSRMVAALQFSQAIDVLGMWLAGLPDVGAIKPTLVELLEYCERMETKVERIVSVGQRFSSVDDILAS